MINNDFKFDLADYLGKSGGAPVGSLGEILDRGLYHSALEAMFRARNAVEARDSDASRRAKIKRVALRQAIEAVLSEHRLTAIAFPTLRRKPARIGDGQAGSTCQVSAHSGLPALGAPAGFTDDGLPVGLELLGTAFAEQELLSLGYAMEQTLNLRRPPFSTPALVGGKPPAPKTATAMVSGAAVKFTYDETTARLQYTVTTTAGDPPSTIWIHLGTPAKPGAGRHLLFGSGQAVAGTVTLAAIDRKALADGALMVRFFPRDGRGTIGDVPIAFAK
jgi:amidase